mmetsp:Transcript_22809/g.42396  ORF Transcript_22809/g.42396 Transcript_22809/m.42396 type:complete len:254 (+) Transcript_22809:20-781(+)
MVDDDTLNKWLDEHANQPLFQELLGSAPTEMDPMESKILIGICMDIGGLLDGNLFSDIVEEMQDGKVTDLKFLTLGDGVEGWALPPQVSKLSALEEFTLQGCNQIPKEIQDCPKLTSLDLYCDEVPSLPEIDLTTLEYFGYNHMGGDVSKEEAQTLLSWITSRLNALQFLDLTGVPHFSSKMLVDTCFQNSLQKLTLYNMELEHESEDLEYFEHEIWSSYPSLEEVSVDEKTFSRPKPQMAMIEEGSEEEDGW